MTWHFTDASESVVYRHVGTGQESKLSSELTPEELSLVPPYEGEDLVPQIVTMRQARLALLQAGLLNSVNAAIDALPSPQKEAAQIEWEYSQEVHRDKEFVVILTGAMGLSESQVNALFVAAASL